MRNETPRARDTERFKTRLGVILAVAGSAIGLGNFLRFPGQAVQHGGGAFMIPYFVALVLLGIPLAWAEWTMGRYGGRHGFHSAPGILRQVTGSRAGAYVGSLGLLVPVVIYMYYVLIESWCLRYAWAYLSGEIRLEGAPEARVAGARHFFEQVSGAGGDRFSSGDAGAMALVFWAVVMLINVGLVHRGLSKGIEAFCRWAMPVMAVCALVVLVRVLTLGTPDPARPEQSVSAGLGFLWNPDFSKLSQSSTWFAAASQIFFSLSVGFGVIINYASYLRDEDDVVLSGLTASATNELFEVGFGGLITVTAAFVFLGASGAIGGVFGVGFQSLPVVFAHMGWVGASLGALWFFMLFLAAVTSSLSMLQPFRAFLREGLGLSFRASSLAIAAVVVPGSLWVFYFSKDLVALDTMDFWVGTFCILLLALLQALIFGWVFGIRRGVEEARRGARLELPRGFGFIVRFVVPVYLLAVLIAFAVQELPAYAGKLFDVPVARNTTLLVAGIWGALLLATYVAERRWCRLGLTAAAGGEGETP